PTLVAGFAPPPHTVWPRVRLVWSWESRPERGTFDEDEPEEGVERARGALDVELLTARAVDAPAPAPAGLTRLPVALAGEADAGAFRERPQPFGGGRLATQGGGRGLR